MTRRMILAIAITAAATGVVIPAIRSIAEAGGGGAATTGAFMAAHVLGGIVGARLVGAALRRTGSARALAIRALAASVAITLAMAAIDVLALRFALRFADGVFHLLALTALASAATSGDAHGRSRRAIAVGLAIVLGVAVGLGAGAAIPTTGALAAAAAISLLAILVTARLPSYENAAVARRDRRIERAPAVLVFAERFTFGSLTVTAPFCAPSSRVGLVLALFMIASIGAFPLAHRIARRVHAMQLAGYGAFALAAVLAVAAFGGVFATPLGAAVWAIAGGLAAGAVYATTLIGVTRSGSIGDRARGLGAVHAWGSAGHATGALGAGGVLALVAAPITLVMPALVVCVAAVIAARPPDRKTRPVSG